LKNKKKYDIIYGRRIKNQCGKDKIEVFYLSPYASEYSSDKLVNSN